MRCVKFSNDREVGYKDLAYPHNDANAKVENWWQHFPSFTYVCFSRISLWFYIVILILQALDTVPLDFRTTLIPILFSIITTVSLDVTLFFRRRKLINRVDRKRVNVLRSGDWHELPWEDVCVGDIIILRNGDQAPADCVLLNTSNGQHIAIDTHIIDGQTQLRARSPLPGVHQFLPSELTNPNFTLECERKFNPEPADIAFVAPISSQLKFTAKLSVDNQNVMYGNPPRYVQITNSQFIERYSLVYHVGDVFCGVIYTGSDCRSVTNNHITKPKFTSLEKKLNIFNALSVGAIILFASVVAAVSLIFRPISQSWPFNDDSNVQEYFGITMVNYMILLLPMSPLELYSIVDIVLFIHSFFIQAVDEGTSVPSIASIDYLTDINTIITSKSMIIDRMPTIKRVHVNGVTYGQCDTAFNASHNGVNAISSYNNEPFYDDRLIASEQTRLFFTHLALCHNAMAVSVGDFIGYASRFSEEESLLKLAAQYGFTFANRNKKEVTVNIGPYKRKFLVQHILPPSPLHPRVSIVFQDMDGTVKVLTRGTTEVMSRVVSIPSEIEHGFLGEGLQVLCLSYKVITPQDYNKFLINIREATMQGEQAPFGVIEDFERGGEFLGLIGLEEQQRSGSLLFANNVIRSGMQIVLESPAKASSLAITALSYGMVNNKSKVGLITETTPDSLERCLDFLIAERSFDAMLINGKSIEFIIQSPRSYEIANVIKQAPLILIERSDADQVAAFARYLRYNGNTVMTIGHSVLDSIVMQKSDISVSVGTDAVCPCNITSDIIVPKFESLTNIIFIQGGWVRERLYSLLNFIFPRNFVFAFMQLAYGTMAALSGTPLIDESQQLSLLLVFTAVPALTRAITNQKFPDSLLRASPIYYERRRVDVMSFGRYFTALFLSLFVAFAFVFITRFILINFREPYGETISLPQFSSECSLIFMLCCISSMLPNVDTWNVVHHCGTWGSIILYFIITVAQTADDNAGKWRGSMTSVTGNIQAQILTFFFVVMAMFTSASFSLYKKTSIPKQEERSENQSDPIMDTEFIKSFSSLYKTSGSN